MPPSRARITRLSGDDQPVAVPEVELVLPHLDRLLGAPQPLSFKESARARGGRRFDLVGASSLEGTAGERKYKIHPLPENPRTHARYWVAISFAYRAALGALAFESVSVVVFQGTLASLPKSPILRAEWDAYDGENVAHAQPHWHVYPAAALVPVVLRVEHPMDSNGFQVLEDPLEELDAPAVAPDPDHDGLEKMHLAMASQWHLNAGHAPSERPTPTEIVSWLTGCIRYTYEQLQYVAQQVAPAVGES